MRGSGKKKVNSGIYNFAISSEIRSLTENDENVKFGEFLILFKVCVIVEAQWISFADGRR